MSVCAFFGHSECYGLDAAVLRNAIENLIKQGTSEFLVGNYGQFDGMVFSCLQDLSKEYPEISYSVALAYLPKILPAKIQPVVNEKRIYRLARLKLLQRIIGGSNFGIQYYLIKCRTISYTYACQFDKKLMYWQEYAF